MYGKLDEQTPSFHFQLWLAGQIAPQPSFPQTLLGSPVRQLVYVARVPSTHNQREVSLGSLCSPIHTVFDILWESACCSARDFTMASVEPSFSQAFFAAFQLNRLETIL